MLAADGGHEEVVRALLEARPGLTLMQSSMTEIIMAGRRLCWRQRGGHEGIIRALLEDRPGVNVNAIVHAEDSSGWTALMLAAAWRT